MLIGILLIELCYGNWFVSNDLTNLKILKNRTWHYEINYPGILEQDKKITYTRDRWGLRGNYGTPENIYILTIGGSTTDQRYITDGHTWQDVLTKKFAENTKDIHIANAGIDGRTTFGHLHDFNFWFPNIDKLQPNYILFYVGINDMFFSQPNSSHDQAYLSSQSSITKLKNNSAVYSLAHSLVGTYFSIERNMDHRSIDYTNVVWTNNSIQSNYKQRLDKRLENYRKRYTQLLKMASKLNAVPIIVTQPRGDSKFVDGRLFGLSNVFPRSGMAFYDSELGKLDNTTANGVDYYRILSLFNSISMELCEKINAICIDLANELSFDDKDFYDHAHNTRSGAEKIGEYLYSKLSPIIK